MGTIVFYKGAKGFCNSSGFLIGVLGFSSAYFCFDTGDNTFYTGSWAFYTYSCYCFYSIGIGTDSTSSSIFLCPFSYAYLGDYFCEAVKLFGGVF